MTAVSDPTAAAIAPPRSRCTTPKRKRPVRQTATPPSSPERAPAAPSAPRLRSRPLTPVPVAVPAQAARVRPLPQRGLVRARAARRRRRLAPDEPLQRRLLLRVRRHQSYFGWFPGRSDDHDDRHRGRLEGLGTFTWSPAWCSARDDPTAVRSRAGGARHVHSSRRRTRWAPPTRASTRRPTSAGCCGSRTESPARFPSPPTTRTSLRSPPAASAGCSTSRGPTGSPGSRCSRPGRRTSSRWRPPE